MQEYNVNVNDKEYHVKVEKVELVCSNKKKEIVTSRRVMSTDSLKQLLEISMDEYTKSKELLNSLDNKAGLFISACIAYLAFFVPSIPFGKIIAVLNGNNITTVVSMYILAILMGISAMVLLCALCFLFLAFRARSFEIVNYKSLSDAEVLSQEINNVLLGLIKHYNTILEGHEEKNREKGKYLRIGLALMIIAFVALMLILVLIICSI
ncbi:MAG: hypothetical protein RR413_08905 [Christensenellaceae bacterium]